MDIVKIDNRILMFTRTDDEDKKCVGGKAFLRTILFESRLFKLTLFSFFFPIVCPNTQMN